MGAPFSGLLESSRRSICACSQPSSQIHKTDFGCCRCITYLVPGRTWTLLTLFTLLILSLTTLPVPYLTLSPTETETCAVASRSAPHRLSPNKRAGSASLIQPTPNSPFQYLRCTIPYLYSLCIIPFHQVWRRSGCFSTTVRLPSINCQLSSRHRAFESQTPPVPAGRGCQLFHLITPIESHCIVIALKQIASELQEQAHRYGQLASDPFDLASLSSQRGPLLR